MSRKSGPALEEDDLEDNSSSPSRQQCLAIDESFDEVPFEDDGNPYPACRICRGKATGVHYGVQSCEGCKAFFKRGVVKKASYKCYFGRECDITPNTRGRCKACRLQKCIREGMNLDGPKTGRAPKHSKETMQTNLSEIAADMAMAASRNVEREAKSSLSEHREPRSSSSTSGSFAPYSAQSSQISVIRSIRSHSIVPEPLSDPLATSSRDKDARDIREEFGAYSTDNVKILLEHTFLLRNPINSGMLPGFKSKLDLGDNTEASAFMMRYWSIMKERNSCLEVSIKAVTDAVKTCYWDQIEAWTRFMTKALTFGEVPAQPETTLESMVELFQANTFDEVERSVRFAALLPGFSEIPQPEQMSRICERGFHLWMIRHASFMRNDEMYFLTVKRDYHYCRYWLEIILEQDFLDFILKFAQSFNEMNLSLAETYVFMAAALFWPENNDRHKATYENLLYAHYLDALVSMIGSRRTEVLSKLEKLISQFGLIKHIQSQYCLTMDVSNIPIRPAGKTFEKVRASAVSPPMRVSPVPAN